MHLWCNYNCGALNYATDGGETSRLEMSCREISQQRRIIQVGFNDF